MDTAPQSGYGYTPAILSPSTAPHGADVRAQNTAKDCPLLTALDSIYKYTYNRIVDSKQPKPVRWIGASRKDVRSFPQAVRRDIGKALYAAQHGETDPAAKPLKGFGGTSVMEIVAPHAGDTWRAVYTVRFRDALYVLHAFQKKSKTGIATPRKDIDLIRQRLADAEHDYRQRQN
jgi:phage-related protein